MTNSSHQELLHNFSSSSSPFDVENDTINLDRNHQQDSTTSPVTRNTTVREISSSNLSYSQREEFLLATPHGYRNQQDHSSTIVIQRSSTVVVFNQPLQETNSIPQQQQNSTRPLLLPSSQQSLTADSEQGPQLLRSNGFPTMRRRLGRDQQQQQRPSTTIYDDSSCISASLMTWDIQREDQEGNNSHQHYRQLNGMVANSRRSKTPEDIVKIIDDVLEILEYGNEELLSTQIDSSFLISSSSASYHHNCEESGITEEGKKKRKQAPELEQ